MSPADEVLRTFYDIRDALKGPDPAALDKLIAEDYRGFDLRGDVENREAILEFYQPGRARLEKFEVDDLRTHVSGELGVVTGLGFLSGRFGGDVFDHTVRFCDILVLRDSRWQLLFTQTTEVVHFERD